MIPHSLADLGWWALALAVAGFAWSAGVTAWMTILRATGR